jgi:hypothetical protein
MREIKTLWIPVLLGAVLIATVVGVASARPNARPEQQAWRVLTVPSTACIPQEVTDDWWLGANRVHCASGSCHFFCAVDFPAAGEQAVGAVNVKRVTMFAYNYSGDATAVMFYLYKVYPPNKAYVVMASGSTTNSPADPQTVVDTTIANNPIFRVQNSVISVTIGVTGTEVYGFHIHYTW